MKRWGGGQPQKTLTQQIVTAAVHQSLVDAGKDAGTIAMVDNLKPNINILVWSWFAVHHMRPV